MFFLFVLPQHQPDLAIGVHLMDRYTFYLLEFLEDIHPASKSNMNDLVSVTLTNVRENKRTVEQTFRWIRIFYSFNIFKCFVN